MSRAPWDEARDKGLETGQPRVESIALLNLALLHWRQDRTTDAMAAAKRAVMLTTRMGAAERSASEAMVELLERNEAGAANEALPTYMLRASHVPDLFNDGVERAESLGAP
jgi:hypothetical protein